MNVKKILIKYVGSFLKEQGFFMEVKESSRIDFRFEQNPNLIVGFDFYNKGRIHTYVRKLKSDDKDSYELTLFFDEPEKLREVFRDDSWYYDTEEELIGALEEQVKILEIRGFDWLFGKANYNMGELLSKKAKETALYNDSLNPQEQRAFAEKIGKDLQNWRDRRVLPKKWSV